LEGLHHAHQQKEPFQLNSPETRAVAVLFVFYRQAKVKALSSNQARTRKSHHFWVQGSWFTPNSRQI
jgi:hypothetical protein